ncbi:MAG: NifU family protein [Deltaproteobacteria bacterium]|nr:NifU family protein [Deltaproteobacteria bacterium]
MIRSTLKAGLVRLRRVASDVRRRQDPAPVHRPAPEPPRARADPAPPAPASSPPTEEAVRQVLEETIRPALQSDGGDIELVGLEGGEVRVRLRGACQGCPSAEITLRMGVEAFLKEEFPGVTRVVAVP